MLSVKVINYFFDSYSGTFALVFLLQKRRWISWTIMNAFEEEETYFLLDTQNYLELESFFKYCFSNVAIVWERGKEVLQHLNYKLIMIVIPSILCLVSLVVCLNAVKRCKDVTFCLIAFKVKYTNLTEKISLLLKH